VIIMIYDRGPSWMILCYIMLHDVDDAHAINQSGLGLVDRLGLMAHGMPPVQVLPPPSG
jgi:hypothetical protein